MNTNFKFVSSYYKKKALSNLFPSFSGLF